MKELIITGEMREKINTYLGYELIKQNEIGHHIFDEAPGLGKIGIEGSELDHVVTNKQLDSNGNVEWYKNPHPKERPGRIKPFHCKLTTVSSKKAKILIASLFPEEALDRNFQNDNQETIEQLRGQLKILKGKDAVMTKRVRGEPTYMIMGPNDMFFEGAKLFSSLEMQNEEINPLLYGPNDLPMKW